MISRTEMFRQRAVAAEQRATQTADDLAKAEWTELATQWHYMASVAAGYQGGTRTEDAEITVA